MRVGGGVEAIVSTDSGSTDNVTFSVLVRASDDGWPSLSTTSTLHVVIVNVATASDDDQLDFNGWTEAGASSAHPKYRSDHVCVLYRSLFKANPPSNVSRFREHTEFSRGRPEAEILLSAETET